MEKHVIVFEPSGLRMSVDKQYTFLDAIRAIGLHVSSQCGGKGTCGKCRVKLHRVIDPSPADTEHLSTTEIDDGFRLACQHKVDQDFRVLLSAPQRNIKILSEGVSGQKDWKVDNGKDDQLGVAIDLGTTTIVAYLLDRSSGVQLGQEAELNPQVIFGEDVMSRITHVANTIQGEEELSGIVTKTIDDLISRLVAAVGMEERKVTGVSIVGNTAMHHLLLKADVKPLGLAPYEPTIREAVTSSGQKIGFVSVPDSSVYLPPNIAGFVGGDTVGFILSQGLDKIDDIVLGIDIGTNGEIVLSNRGELSCCSAAAGSAFEGATIYHGMRGKNGAIEYMSISNLDDPPEIAVIGNEVPQGICGSGIVDLTAEMLQCGILSPNGKMQTDSKRVFQNDEGFRYLITNNQESEAERDIVFTQKDIRQVQLAKGAILAGATILLNDSDLEAKDLDSIMLAGAFGSYIRPESAIGIGLVPQIESDKIIQVGNAAGEGAKTLLLSTQSRNHVNKIVSQIHYLELANHADFQSVFLDSLAFP
ncbi:MAG: ASKHA domain-containing protein [Candidatus Thorarchaeota archaeon]